MTRILHVMGQFPEKYNSKFYDFFESNFNYKYKSFYLPLVIKNDHYSSNIIKLKQSFFYRVSGLIKNILFNQNDIIIFHGFFFDWKYLIVIDFLMNILNEKKIFIWEVWGGDLYFYKNKKNNFNDNLTETLRKKVIKKFNVISALTNGEVELIKKIYKFNGRSYDAFYPLPVKLTDCEVELFEIDEFSIIDDDFYIIGNSGDPTNNHKSIIDMLFLKKYNGFLYFPLAYGDKDYIKEVTEYANKVFPSKCYFQYDFISPNKYNHVMIEAKGGIFNHNRQQALGNILSLLYHNKEVYMNKNILSFKDLKSRGISIYDLNEFGDVIPRQNNKNIIDDNFSDKKASELWAKMIKDLIDEKN